MKKTKQIHVFVNSEIYDKLSQESKEKGIGFSELARQKLEGDSNSKQ